MASPLTGLAGLPPILPQVPGTPGPPAGGTSASTRTSGLPQMDDPMFPGLVDPKSGTLIPGTVAPGGSISPFVAGGWSGVLHTIMQEAEVYGFLFLLVAIGLYGLFAPQVNTVIKTAGKAAAAA